MKFDEWAVRRWLDANPTAAKTILSDYSKKAVPLKSPVSPNQQHQDKGNAAETPEQHAHDQQSGRHATETHSQSQIHNAAIGAIASTATDTRPTPITTTCDTNITETTTNPSSVVNAMSSASLHHYELIFDVAKIVYSSLDLQTVMESVLSVAASLVNAERCSVFLLDKTTNELHTLAFDVGNGSQEGNGALGADQTKSPYHSRNSLVMSHADGNSSSVAEDLESTERTRHLADVANKHHKPNPGFRIPVGSGVAGYVAQTRVGLNIKDAYADKRFNSSVDKQTGFKTDSILCLPIFGPASENGQPELIGVASLINKLVSTRRVSDNGSNVASSSHVADISNHFNSDIATNRTQASLHPQTTPAKSTFNEEDTILFKNLLVLVGIAIKNAKQYEETKRAQLSAADLASRNAELYEMARLESNKANVMLKLAGTLYKEDNTKELVKKIIGFAKDLMCADKASFFIVDREKGVLHSTVFDDATVSSFSVPINKGIAGYVASTGNLVNLEDAYTDERFNPEVDVKTNYRTRSMLCVPVPGPDGNIVGVAYLINKQPSTEKSTNPSLLPRRPTKPSSPPRFTKADEELFSSFSIYCGLALHKTMLLEEIENQRRRLAITMELMSFHSIVRDDEKEKHCKVIKTKMLPIEQIRDVGFDPHMFLQTDETLAAITYQMFVDLAFGTRYSIPDEKLINYILTVRKNYRPVSYHNFTHAVSVSHSFYTFVVSGAFDGIMDHLEIFATFVACLNHDIDHRGTNNQFQKQAQTELATFYSTSTMERHHFNHAMTILSHGTGLNILEHLNTNDYQRVLKIIEHAILSTDLGVFFANRGKVTDMIKNGGFDGTKAEHRDLVRGLTMTCSDLGAMYKPWEAARKTADSVYEEFFQQGDEERRLGMALSGELMDRAKMADIPRMQFDFYKFVVTPAFELLYGVLGARVQKQFDGVATNCVRWKELQDSGMKYFFGMDV